MPVFVKVLMLVSHPVDATEESTQSSSRDSHSGIADNISIPPDTDICGRASVFSLVKTPESSISERMTGIYALDDDLTKWWSEVRPDFKLESTNITSVAKDHLSIILLINLVFHQSLCALHASVVPLFSWTVANDSWSSARQSSAQMAFEHACTASVLINAATSLHASPSPTHTFIAYTAYSGCAIQIPFMWCLNAAVRERATTNVRTNIKMIRAMAPYWKFAALLVSNPQLTDI